MAWLRALFVLVVVSSSVFAAPPPQKGVNAVLGDDSWIARYGVVPDESVDEDLRLRVHLEYVEAMLRAQAPSGLSDEQRAERERNLDRLRAYIERGEFPRNRSVEGRRPHFIDEDGRICAVGYLIEQSAGRDVAEQINRAHEWDFIGEIRGIDHWVAQSGLTVAELAMIQPSYGWRPRPMPPPPDEDAVQRRLVMNAFESAARGVQGCADHWEPWREMISVSVTVSRWGSSVSVHAGSHSRSTLRFRRCVQREIERRVANIAFSWRVTSMTVKHTFTLDPPTDDGDFDDNGGGWAQPPPY